MGFDRKMDSNQSGKARLRRSRLLSIPRQIQHITLDLHRAGNTEPRLGGRSEVDQEKLVTRILMPSPHCPARSSRNPASRPPRIPPDVQSIAYNSRAGIV